MSASLILYHLWLLGGLHNTYSYASDTVTVETQSGTKYTCNFSHRAQSSYGEGDYVYYICQGSRSQMILVRNAFAWQAVAKTQSEAVPGLEKITSVMKGSQIIYQVGDSLGMNLGEQEFWRPESLDSKYRMLSAVMQTLDPDADLSDGSKKERKKGTAEFENIWKVFNSKIHSERDRITEKFKSISSILVELSNGQSIQCRRGRSRPPSALLKASQMFMDKGCEYFICPSVTLDGRTYDALLVHGTSPDESAVPTITLSRKDELGPAVSVVSTYAGTKIADNLLYKQFLSSQRPSETTYLTPKFQVPEKLRNIEGVLPLYFNAQWMENRRYLKSRCDQKEVDDLLIQEDKAFDGIKDILASVQAVQLVSRINGALSSELIPMADIPAGSCQLSPGVYVSEGSYSYGGEFEWHLQNGFERAISYDEAMRLFQQVAAMKDIPFEYLQDGCQARAHVIADRLAQMGVSTEKVWITGDLYPAKNPQIGWRFHVAVAVPVKKPDGNVEKMVIDPSLTSELISVDHWASLIPSKGKGPLTYASFPPPANAAFYQRPVVSFSSNSIYVPYGESSKYSKPEVAMLDAINMNAGYLNYLATKKR